MSARRTPVCCLQFCFRFVTLLLETHYSGNKIITGHQVVLDLEIDNKIRLKADTVSEEI